MLYLIIYLIIILYVVYFVKLKPPYVVVLVGNSLFNNARQRPLDTTFCDLIGEKRNM